MSKTPWVGCWLNGLTPFATGVTGSKESTPAVTGGDWAARYMAWMALGGTLVRVPDAPLNIVATTPVLGVRRSQRLAATPSPKMLKLAQALCAQVLNPTDYGPGQARLDADFFSHGRFKSAPSLLPQCPPP
ncbi:MAG: hypothetical protein ABIS92_17800 [Polyangia bacterium]